jgi:polysaccharide deacetylase 2 family uncharacterized protein YibQ
VRYAFWALLILFALCALAGGYFSGTAAVSVESPAVESLRAFNAEQTDELALDDFAADPAVVSGASAGDLQSDAHLAIVLVGCGHSYALEAPFLTLDIPIAMVIEPDAPAARAIGDAAQRAGATTFVQATLAATPQQIIQMHGDFPRAAGLAARFERAPSRQILQAMRSLELAAFDEYGDAAHARKTVRAGGVRYVSRTITVDDHLQPAYVQYMLAQAVHLGRASRAVVMARPLPGTLRALQALIAEAPRDGIVFDRVLQ